MNKGMTDMTYTEIADEIIRLRGIIETARGIGFLGRNPRFRGFESSFVLDTALVALGVGVRWLRETQAVPAQAAAPAVESGNSFVLASGETSGPDTTPVDADPAPADAPADTTPVEQPPAPVEKPSMADSKAKWEAYAGSLGIDYDGMTKAEIVDAVNAATTSPE